MISVPELGHESRLVNPNFTSPPTPLSGIFLTFGGRQSLHDLQHLSSLIVFSMNLKSDL